jgi:hypothetical protein
MQYESRQIDEEEKDRIVVLREFREFLNRTTNRHACTSDGGLICRFTRSLKENEMLNIFRDRFDSLGQEEIAFENASQTSLQVS